MKSPTKRDLLIISVLLVLVAILIPSEPTLSAPIPYDELQLPELGEMILSSDQDIPRHIWVAGQYLKRGEFQKTIAICKRVLKVKADHVEARAYLAAAYKGIGEDDAFNTEANIIKERAPKSPALYVALAQTYIFLKDFKKAEIAYKNGIETALKKTDLHMGLAALYLEQERLNEATTEFNKVLGEKKVAPKDFLNANFALCKIELQQKKYDQVIKRAKKVTELYPPIPQGYFLLGTAYLGKGEADQAIKSYEKLMKVNPRSSVPYQELAIIYKERLGDKKKALQYAEAGVKKFSKDPKSQDVLGWIHYQMGKYPEALRYFQVATQLAEKDPNYLYHLGLANQKIGNKAEAKLAFEKALGRLAENKKTTFTEEIKRRIDQCK